MKIQVVLACILTLTGGTVAGAQDNLPLGKIIRQVALDPTTYVPSILVYDSSMKDWDTSQPFFRNGFVEHNYRFTVSGRPDDYAITYTDGRNKIIRDSLSVAAVSAVHNFGIRLIEQGLRERYPEHKKLITVLSWAERIAVASAMSNSLAGPHYRQARDNKHLSIQLGF